jgi:hypothetical protein
VCESHDLSSWLSLGLLGLLWGILLVVPFIPVLYFVSMEGFTISVVEGIVVLFLEVLLFPFVMILLSQLWTTSFLWSIPWKKCPSSLYDRDQTLEA